MVVCAGYALAQIYGRALEINRVYLCNGQGLLGSRFECFVLFVELSVLGREPIAIYHDPSLRRLQPALEDKPCDAGSLVEKLILGHLVKAKVFPPVGLVLASVPFEDLREDPLRFLVATALNGEMRCQRLRDGANAR